MTDDRPRCTLAPRSAGPSTCYCTGRPGCQMARDDYCAGCGGQGCHECDDWADLDPETQPPAGAP